MKKIGGCLSAFLIGISLILNFIYGSAKIEMISVLFMLAFLILLIFEVFPVTLSCLLALGFMPITGMTANFNIALSGFSNQVVFFILASSGMALALTKTPLAKRLLRFILCHFQKSNEYLVLAFMVCAALTSSIISNVPTCALFLSITIEFLEFFPEAEKKQNGRTLMIAIPLASMIGGIMTPAGSSINLLAINLLAKYTGETITFLQWMSIGVPATILILPIAWFILIKIFPPSEIEKKQLDQFLSTFRLPEKLLSDEIRVMGITGIMLVLWILSSFISGINIMVVALLGCCAFCMPHLGVLDVNEFIKKNSWDAFFLVGTVLSLGNALVNNGLSDSFVRLLPDFSNVPNFFFLLFIALITFLLLIIIPVAPSLVTFMTPAIIETAIAAGFHPAMVTIVCAMCACNCYLLPLDTVCLLTYSKGYYSMSDMPKVTAPLQLCISVIIVTLGIGVGYLLGWV
ncbi:MAG: SLC13 family permease [Agathobacter sp.]